MAISNKSQSTTTGSAKAGSVDPTLIMNTLKKMDIPMKSSKTSQKLFASLGANAQMVISPTSDVAGTLLHQVKTADGKVKTIAKASYNDINEFRKLTLSASIKTKQGLNSSRKLKLNSDGYDGEEVATDPAESEEVADIVTSESAGAELPGAGEETNELFNALQGVTGDVQTVQNAVVFNAVDPATGETTFYVAFKDEEEGQYVAAPMMEGAGTYSTPEELASAYFSGAGETDEFSSVDMSMPEDTPADDYAGGDWE